MALAVATESRYAPGIRFQQGGERLSGTWALRRMSARVLVFDISKTQALDALLIRLAVRDGSVRARVL